MTKKTAKELMDLIDGEALIENLKKLAFSAANEGVRTGATKTLLEMKGLMPKEGPNVDDTIRGIYERLFSPTTGTPIPTQPSPGAKLHTDGKTGSDA